MWLQKSLLSLGKLDFQYLDLSGIIFGENADYTETCMLLLICEFKWKHLLYIQMGRT